MYKQGWSFGAINHPFLFHIFSLLVLILIVSPDFKAGRRFQVSGSIAVSVVAGLVCGLTEGILG